MLKPGAASRRLIVITSKDRSTKNPTRGEAILKPKLESETELYFKMSYTPFAQEKTNPFCALYNLVGLDYL